MRRWIIVLIIVLVLGIGGYFGARNTQIGRSLVARVTGTKTTTQTAGSTATITSTVEIQPAATILQEVSASGHIELIGQTSVALASAGTINQVNINVGDVVTVGQVLLTLDTTDLERAVTRAQIAVDTALNKQAQTAKPATAAEITAAEAKLTSAKAALVDAQTPPSAAEIAAAQSSIVAAQAKYDDLVKGPSADKLTQLSADLKKAEVTVAEAQRSYDRVAWRNEVGMTSEAATLQSATIAYESAKAAYQESTAPASTADLQSALSSIKSAQKVLEDLKKKPDAASIASAEANVADAQNALDTLKTGADALSLKADQLSLQSALIDLEEAGNNLAHARVTAPISGTVLSVNAEAGQRASQGTVVVTLADPSKLKLTIDVAEVDISQIRPDQPVQIAIDAFPGRIFEGKVGYVAPSSSSTSGLIEYPVTVLLTDKDLADVRAGMTAVATISSTSRAAENSWFVPTNAISQRGNDKVVIVVRNSTNFTAKVTPGTIQGEWTVVQSPDLKAGDAVAGSVTTKINNNQPRFGPGGGGPPPGGG